MSGGHRHAAPSHQDHARLVAGRPLRIGFSVLILAITAVAVGGLIALWPNQAALKPARSVDPYAGVTFVSGTVRSITDTVCKGSTEDRLADGSIPAKVGCVSAAVKVPDRQRLDGLPGPVRINVPPEVSRAGLGVGDKIRMTWYPAASGVGEIYAWSDYDRRVPLSLLAICFVLVVVAVAWLKGLAALVGLVIAFPMITEFMLPALRAGSDPVAVALVGATVIMVVVLYLTHGVSTKTTVALLGTLAGLLASSGLAWWVTVMAHLDGLNSEQDLQLSRLTTGAGLNGLVLCGVIIASLGVLNDVTIAQAASIWELRSVAPNLRAGALFRSGMRIGRDHLASVVYTIAFASAGAALPTMVLINLYQEPLIETLNGGQIAEEIVRTLVAAIGLVLTIPLTTAIAAVVATAIPVHTSPEQAIPIAAHSV